MGPRRPRLFWDSSGLIAALMSTRPESAGRVLMRLGETRAVDMRLSADVAHDTEWVFRQRRRPELLANLAVVLDRAGFVSVPEPDDATVEMCADLTGYWADARVLAAAEDSGADVLVTMDRRHFIGNPLIGPPATNCRVMTPHDALTWCRGGLAGGHRERQMTTAGVPAACDTLHPTPQDANHQNSRHRQFL